MTRAKNGFTLIELLAVVAIIGLLTALLLPAVQASREAARRAACVNNLRQIGVALHNYLGAHSVFPAATNGSGYSFLAAVLPQLDQRPLYDALNFSFPAENLNGGIYNSTVSRSQVGVFLCPSGASMRQAFGQTSYAGNWSPGYRPFTDEGAFPGLTLAPSPRIGYLTAASFTDGLSQTVAVSEWVVGDPSASGRDERGAVFSYPAAAPGDLQGVVAGCRTMDTRMAAVSFDSKGASWLDGSYAKTLYNHAMIPNGRSCTNNGSMLDGVFTAGSAHPGGENSLFADGSTRFVPDSVSPQVWRAIGSRNGGEIGNPAF